MLLWWALAVLLPWASSSAKVIKMFHLSDLHLDANYSVFGDVQNRCHVNESAPIPSSPVLSPAGVYPCDPPRVLVNSAFDYLKQSVSKDPEFIIWTGDSNPHWFDGPKFPYILSNMRNISKALQSNFPHSVIVPALGNHDTYEPDNYPDFKADTTTAGFYDKYIEQGSLGDFLEAPAREIFKKCGYYNMTKVVEETDISYKLKFVVLNTNLYYHNKLELDPEDPCGQLAWLRAVLEDTHVEEKVFVMAHIPPGFFERGDMGAMFNSTKVNGDKISKAFAEIFRDKKLSSKIVAHFYGHTHTDAFRLFRNSIATSSVAFIQSSVTPAMYLNSESYGVNPSVRMYTYNLIESKLLDYQQHYLDLAAAQEAIRNATLEHDRSKRDDTDTEVVTTLKPQEETTLPADKAKEEDAPAETTTTTTTPAPVDKSPPSISDILVKHWKWGYNATTSFGIKDLSIKQMTAAFVSLTHDGIDGDVFKRYYKHNTNFHHPADDKPCDNACYSKMICAIVSFDLEERDACLALHEVVLPAPGSEAEAVQTAPPAEKVQEESTTAAPAVPEKKVPEESAKTEKEEVSTTAPVEKKDDDDGSPSVTSVPDDHSVRGVFIGFSIVIVLAIAVAGLFVYRKVQRNRYRAQEFLLTDSVFRYDGYAQVDDP